MYSEAWMQHTTQVRARFESEPPADLRKSNFFHFRVELRAENGAPLDVTSATFLHFLHEQGIDNQLRNGIKYAITMKYPSGLTQCRDLYLTLVDANTREPIRYEGHDDNPKMQRVLLTHEAICTRCSLNKSCGNKNEAPSDPAISGRGLLKFFLKCNQNCLKGAGNPRDTRRFALAVSLDDSHRVLALSRPIFVHNNSKHSRNKRKRDGARIEYTVGPSADGMVVVVGENFRQGDRLYVDDEAALGVMHRSENVMEAWISPPSSAASTCRLNVQSGEHYLDGGTLRIPSAPLACVSTSARTFDFVSPRWAVTGVSFVCGQTQLPILALTSRHAAKVSLPRSIPSGFVSICVLWRGMPCFTFPFRVMEKEDFERQTLEPMAGYTCLYSRRNCPDPQMVETDPRNSVVFVDEVDLKPGLAHQWAYPDGGYYDPCRSFSSSSSDTALHSSPTL